MAQLKALPEAESMGARAVLAQIVAPRHALVNIRNMAGRHPLHGEHGFTGRRKPLLASAQQLSMGGAVGEIEQGIDSLPDRYVDQDILIRIGVYRGGVAAFTLPASSKAGRMVRKRVYLYNLQRTICHD